VPVLPGGLDVLEELLGDEHLAGQRDAVAGLQELKQLLQYCALYNITDKVQPTQLILVLSYNHLLVVLS